MKRHLIFLITLSLVLLEANGAPLPNALPSGANIVSGAAAVSQSNNQMQVNQSSQKAIIRWESFNIGDKASVHFQQPAGGVALNRINPNQGASQIYGQLTATGKIILVNQAGIHFGPNAYVNVGGIIASTSDISNDNFLAGNYIFDQPGTGSIINQGKIIAAENGLVALVGNNVSNEGIIQARMGNVILASGNKFTVSLNGDQLINFTVDEGVSRSDAKTGVNHSGKILADGGRVFMTAKAAQGVMDRAINMSGVVEARSISQKNGEIILGGNEGKVTVSGKLDTSGTQGGTIKVLAKNIEIAGTATLYADGLNGGGTILIGGHIQGKGKEQNAKNVSVEKNAVLSANAIHSGNGGTIVVWADDATQFHGSISAKGGLNGGNGGFAETSGHYLDVKDATVNLLAPKGKTGTWLLDPSDLTISNAADNNINFSSDTYTSLDTPSNVNVTQLQSALATANILVQTNASGTGGNGDITVLDAISWNAPTTLTLSAYRNIVLNNTITGTGGAGLSLIANNAGVFAVGSGNGTVTAPLGTITMSGPVKIYYNPSAYTTPTSYTNSGAGTLTAYMLINNVNDLQNMNTNLSGNYALSTTIDASATSGWNAGAGFQPISTYTGQFDGQNFTVQNLFINRPTTDDVGLFGIASSTAVINNLNLTGLNVSGRTRTGGLIGTNSGTINNAHVAGSVVGFGNQLGGFVGLNNTTGIIDSSTSAANVSSGTLNILNIGGFAGQNSKTITNSSSTGNLTFNNNASQIGGFIGLNTGAATSLANVYSTGNIIAANGTIVSVGGFIGFNTLGTIDGAPNSSSATAACGGSHSICGLGALLTSGSGSYGTTIGGFIGANTGNVSNISTDVDVQGTGNVGGFIASINGGTISNNTSSGTVTAIGSNALTSFGGFTSVTAGGASITNSSSSGDVIIAGTSKSMVGGFVGEHTATISNSFSTGNVIIQNSTQIIGGFAGFTNGGNITNSYATSNINVTNGSVDQVGGFVGSNRFVNLSGAGTIAACGSSSLCGLGSLNSSGTGSYNTNIGGFIGLNTSGNISNVFSTINVNGLTNVGGLIGSNSGGNITNAYSTGDVTGTTAVGGFIGSNTGAIATGIIGSTNGKIFSTGTVTINNNGSNGGGLIGSNTRNVRNAFSTSNVIGTNVSNVGGLIGLNSSVSAGTVINSYSAGSVTVSGTTNSNIGGFIGNATNGTVNNSYSKAAVTGTNVTNMGGFIGLNNGTINTSYSASPVSGTNITNLGGFVGNNTGTINRVFWDTSVTGQTNGAGLGTLTNSAGGCYNGVCPNGGTANLFQSSTYTTAPFSWDFATVWNINNGLGYPNLRSISAYVISGTSEAPNQAISLAANGAVVATTTTNVSGRFNFILASNSIANNGAFVAYLTGGTAGNVVGANFNNGNSIADLSISTNAIQIGQNYIPITSFSNTDLANAKGALSTNDILYTSTGNDLLLGNATHSTVAFNTTANTPYIVNGTIDTDFNSSATFGNSVDINSTGITTTGNQTYNNTVTLGSDTTLDAGSSAMVFNNTLNSNGTPRHLVLDGSGTKTLNNAVGNTSALASFTSNGPLVINYLSGITTNGDQTYNNNVTLGQSTTLTGGGNFNLNNITVTGTGFDLTLQSTSNVNQSFTIAGNFFLNNLIINGGTATNDLTVASSSPQTWLLTGANSGTVSGVTGMTGLINFTDIQNISGGDSNDNFTMNAGSSINSIDGNAGENTLTIGSGDSNWNITGNDSGDITGFVNAYTSIGNLVGSPDGVATFKFLGEYTISGTINGGNTDFVNAIDVSSVLPLVHLTLGPKTGNLLNKGFFATSNTLLTNFENIQYALGNYGQLTTNPESYMDSLIKTGEFSGIIGDPFVFDQFVVAENPIPPVPPTPPVPVPSAPVIMDANVPNIITGADPNFAGLPVYDFNNETLYQVTELQREPCYDVANKTPSLFITTNFTIQNCKKSHETL